MSQVENSNDSKSHGVFMVLCGTIEVELKVTRTEKTCLPRRCLEGLKLFRMIEES